MELDHVPEHLLVMGGGYIGVEFGQMFRRFGSKVTIIQRAAQLLQHEDLDVAREVAEVLRDEGIEVEIETQVVHLADGEGTHTVRTKAPQGLREYTCSEILVAIGRIPNTDDLGLDRAGISTDEKGYVKVDDRLQTSVPGVYAIGDVKGGPAFTHISFDDYRVLKANLIDGKSGSIANRMVPYTVFMDPQLGRIGMTEKEAREKGLQIKVARIPMKHVARALETDETRGMIKAVVDAKTERILGAAVLGLEGGEVMTMLQIAMMGDLLYTRLRDAIFSHPGLAEALNSLFANFEE
jgi:pyruvate/2-oxoglutarate dehydrogenase complex dihydrolipoamide dehydrogenase (E3) component